MKNIKKLFAKCVIALIVITGFKCAAGVAAAIFIPLIGAAQWTNVNDENNTFFFIVSDDSNNISSFEGNENLPAGGQAHFTGAFNNHDIHFTYDAGVADITRAGKTYKGTINDASTVMTLNGTDAVDPLPLLTLEK